MPRQASLLSSLPQEDKWVPPLELPVLDDRYKVVGLDSESDGTEIWGRSLPIGVSIALEDGRKFYFPFGHVGGGNLDRELVARWMRRELRGKSLAMAEAKFEIHMLRKIGVDLEAIGCKPHEVQFKAALLSDTRTSFKLDDLAQDHLGRQKLEMERGEIWQLPAFRVGPYAELDAELTLQLHQKLSKTVAEEGLQKVADLEDDLIYCVCEMERNGALIDVEKLARWQKAATERYQRAILKLYTDVGFRVNPDSGKDLERVFRKFDLDFELTAVGNGSFTDKFLKTVNHPVVRLIREARTISSLKSKYLEKYQRAIGPDNILRFKLHQLKGNEYGTISGRFSSSSINIQQVFDPERQVDKFGSSDFIIRELFVPEPGTVWVKADASQIEFRLFAHYSGSERLIAAYRENPYIDFHAKVGEILKRKRKLAKGLNFGFIYGMGRDKLSNQLGVTREESDELYDLYNLEFPEVRALMNKAMDLAKRRGFVKTILGRKARFANGERLHSALNRVIQGTAADVLKRTLIEVYRNRADLGLKMRFTVHDELDGDMTDLSKLTRLKEILETPYFSEIKVPLIWDIKEGETWAL